MGAWGTGLYDDDTACDVRARFREIARLPVPPAEVAARMAREFGMGEAPHAEEEVDFWLALADRFHRYGIDHPPVMATARGIIDSGADLAAKQALDMTAADLARRAAALAALRAAWDAPHPKPRARRMLKGPERLVLTPGEIWAYPTMDHAALPFHWHLYDSRTIGEHFRPDGWGAFAVPDTWHHEGFYARYLIALAHLPKGGGRPTAEQIVAAPLQVIREQVADLDPEGALIYRPQDLRAIWGVHMLKPGKALRLWQAERVGRRAPDPDRARTAVTGPLRQAILRPDGLASMEHLLTLTSFFHQQALCPEPASVGRPDPDLRMSDLLPG
ncbi:hypothetical protein GE300_03335 [Rhodobacteraceae bacterium 2CG4]|uniref:DUF4259 domain-containing protein n=1 Tax=Halovulum marinum TaxID=2662447 RepID=A0A6L5YXQ6_9RHOB|nr:hypothetical protein [Halovulum marinum]MSU88652.1 hypothetical protein [Halovulum marinum]